MEIPIRVRMSSVVLFVLALLASAHAASAAHLISVSYTVSGGLFSGPLSGGPITGGTVSFTPLVPKATPFASLGTWAFSLTGPGGSFVASGMAVASVGPGGVPVAPAQFLPLGSVSSGGYAGPTLASPIFTFAAFPSGGYGGLVGGIGSVPSPAFFSHTFVVAPGSEVRTIPEPASGALLGLGLVLMGVGVVGRSLRVAERARRGRRS